MVPGLNWKRDQIQTIEVLFFRRTFFLLTFRKSSLQSMKTLAAARCVSRMGRDPETVAEQFQNYTIGHEAAARACDEGKKGAAGVRRD